MTALTAALGRRHLAVALPTDGPLLTVASGLPLTADDVRAILADPRLPYPVVTLVQQGTTLDPTTYTRTVRMAGSQGPTFVDCDAVAAAMANGATAMLPNLETWLRPVADICVCLAREISTRVAASVFVTPPAERGLPLHRDRVHVLAIQLAGHKTWRVHAPEPAAPAGPVRDSPGPLALVARLAPGDVLWLPVGAAHDAFTDNEESIHLSFSIAPGECSGDPIAGTGVLPAAARDPRERRLVVGPTVKGQDR